MKTTKILQPEKNPEMIHELFNISEVQVSYRPEFKMSEKPQLTSSQETYHLLMQVWNHDTLQYLEQFYIILLSRSNRALGIYPVSKGSVSGTLVDPKIIFTTALKGNACNIILAHNHPSSNLKPSQGDMDVTHKLVAIGKLLEMPVIDHLIVTSEGYVSFADQGWI